MVFFAGSFSFSEDFKANTPFSQALHYAALSANFWVTAGTILIGEPVVKGIVSYQWVAIKRLIKLGRGQNQASINAILASSYGIILFAPCFYIINPVAYLPILGVSIFTAMYLILILRSIQNVKTDSEDELKALKF